MLFEEPILETKQTPKKSSPSQVFLLEGECEISKFHNTLLGKNLHHAFLLPQIYENFDNLMENFLHYFTGASFERFNLKPNENGNILIESFEEALNFAQKTSFANKKAIVIYGVCQLSLNVANALLKILEEPPKETYFLLIYYKKEQILNTINSRSILVNFKNSNENFSFLYKNFIKTSLSENEVYSITGGRINILPIFLNEDAKEIIDDFKLLIQDKFLYIKFKKFFTTHNKKPIFLDLIFLLIESEVSKYETSKNLTQNPTLYFSFILQKKYVNIYNTNLEAFLYYTIYRLCLIIL
jgi:hypothetical protein